MQFNRTMRCLLIDSLTGLMKGRVHAEVKDKFYDVGIAVSTVLAVISGPR
jgi:hypothetical protein